MLPRCVLEVPVRLVGGDIRDYLEMKLRGRIISINRHDIRGSMQRISVIYEPKQTFEPTPGIHVEVENMPKAGLVYVENMKKVSATSEGFGFALNDVIYRTACSSGAFRVEPGKNVLLSVRKPMETFISLELAPNHYYPELKVYKPYKGKYPVLKKNTCFDEIIRMSGITKMVYVEELPSSPDTTVCYYIHWDKLQPRIRGNSVGVVYGGAIRDPKMVGYVYNQAIPLNVIDEIQSILDSDAIRYNNYLAHAEK